MPIEEMYIHLGSGICVRKKKHLLTDSRMASKCLTFTT